MGFFDKIKKGLEKTRKSFSESLESILNTGAPADEEFLDELEETLILADLGMETVVKVMGEIRRGVAKRDMVTTNDVSKGLKKLLKDTLNVGSPELNLSTKPSVILVIGVNGVGKTTTIGKIAKQLTMQGKKVTLVAGDTFRAAAADQLEIWAERSGAAIVRQTEGADPASVVFDGIQSAKAKGSDVVIIDTAGRLHNKTNLMNELNKISRDKNSEEAQLLYESEIELFTRDDQSAKYLDLVEQDDVKSHFRVFMYAGAPVNIPSTNAKSVQGALFGKGEDDILNEQTKAAVYFESIAGAINNAIYQRSPYSWK